MSSPQSPVRYFVSPSAARYGAVPWAGLLLLVAAAVGMMVVAPAVRAQGTPTDPAPLPTPEATDGAIRVEVRPAHERIEVQPGNRVHLNIIIEGNEAQAVRPERLPLNVVLVLDKSGSMHGENKWQYVVQAAEDVIRRLGRDDYFSLITYDSTVRTVIPTTRNLDPDWAIRKLRELSPGGSTALHGGLVQGVAAAREHAGGRHVTRVVLLSDGLANVGPSSPQELRAYAEQASGYGVRLSTVGVGLDYNEDLMMGIARESGGTYYFIDDPERIAIMFDEELSGLMNVVARQVEVTIELPPNVRFVESLDRATSIRREDRDGRSLLHLTFPEVSGRQMRQCHIEVELTETTTAPMVRLAEVNVNYEDAASLSRREVAATARVMQAASADDATNSLDSLVWARVIELQSVQNRARAMEAFDSGNRAEGQRLLEVNSGFLTRARQAMPASASPAAFGRIQAQELQNTNEADAYESNDPAARKSQQYDMYRSTH